MRGGEEGLSLRREHILGLAWLNRRSFGNYYEHEANFGNA